LDILVDIDQRIFLFTGSDRESNLFCKAVRNMVGRHTLSVTRQILANFYTNTVVHIMANEIQACNFSRRRWREISL